MSLEAPTHPTASASRSPAVTRYGAAGNGASPRAPHRSAGRVATVAVVLVSFVAMTLLQNVTRARHHELVMNTGAEAKVSNLNSFSLALLLGGLRGPLVMMLWTSSESQKQEKDLEDFNSKIELIRLLQPEFDSVLIFQTWNLAYNISVQMANKANKYLSILDGLEYAYKGDRQHPDDINIVGQIGQIYFDKLGGSQEKEYYTDRVRRESFPDVRVTVPPEQALGLGTALDRANVDSARRDSLLAQVRRNGFMTVDKFTADALRPVLAAPGVTFTEFAPMVFSDTGRRIRIDPILDLNGHLRPDLLAGADPSNPHSYSGSPIAWLQQFGDFPYGVPPMAIGCAYYKRCQVLKDELHQKHLQLSDLVVDNRPAIDTKNWSDAEWGWGRKAEMIALGKELPNTGNYADDRVKMELPTAQVGPDAKVVNEAAAREAMYHYDMVGKTADVAEREFKRHAINFPAAKGNLDPQREQAEATTTLCYGDRDYLAALLQPEGSPGRADLLAKAAKEYRISMLQWEAINLKHNVPEEMMDQMAQKTIGLPGATREDLVDALYRQAIKDPKKASPLDELTFNMAQILTANPRMDIHEERAENERYYRRAYQRLIGLKAAPPLPQ